MKMHYLLGAALALCSSLMGGVASAQDPNYPSNKSSNPSPDWGASGREPNYPFNKYINPKTEVLVLPSSQPPPKSKSGCWWPGKVIYNCCTGQQSIKEWKQDHNMSCSVTHNAMGCGSLCSEINFIFGSCRTFYNEGCQKGPTPSIFPWLTGTPGSGPGGLGSGALGTGGARCPCEQ
jgi:hypothetical protein